MKLNTRSVIVGILMVGFWACSSSTASAANPPKDRVVAMYFHRTERCPTCRKLGSYAEEAVKEAFAKELKAGVVEFHFIDFQDKQNAKLTKAYEIGAPALIITRVSNNKVAELRDLKEMWAKASDKKAFQQYVRDSITAYREKQ